ncbi:amino acid adenylation domain-containing protein [Streptomyces phaeolivaceus]|uniref:Amino acid adenylation domain-containing protein n=1 Tax=Streptomyces phaeolivaceus TaxID=2653200 RepID=A0A5P8K7V3_9ACTN|nr:non-ribosomal peptide synthetase [Streptomyces phaeolivaceus]QFQ99403.1 amino acid adenylation domain-containing protein [Streptomyces phaeolivaceus]
MSGPTPNMTDSAADGAGSVTPDALQRPKWSPERLDPAPGTHVTSAATRLRGTLDESVLATAVADTLRHHPEISTRWADGDGVPVLLTNPRSEQDDLARADIHTTETARACEEFLPTLTASLKPRSFAAALIALGPDDHVLLLVLHETVRGINAAGLITEIGARYGVAAPDGGHAADAAPAPADRPDEAWLDLLTSTPAAEAPADRPRAHVRRPAGARVPVALPADLPASTGRRLSAVLLVAVHTLLARHSGQWTGVVGLREDGRTVPVPLNLPPGSPFDDAVREASDTVAAAHGADGGFLAGLLSSGTDLSRNPMFGVLVEIADGVSATLGTHTADPVRPRTVNTRHDLVVRLLRDTDGQLVGELEYPTSLFSVEAAERLAEGLAELCRSAVRNPLCAIGDLEILPPARRTAALPLPRATAVPVPQTPAYELIAAQAAATPDAVAVEDADCSLTYAGLMALSDALARRLCALGAGPGDLVGIALPRGVELVAALLGVQRAGAAYVPLDPGHPADRLSFVLDDSRARFLVTSAAVRDGLPATSATTVLFEDVEVDGPDRELHVTADLDDTAYVIYTSGSTGRPKGVVVTHRALVNFLWSMRERPGLAPGAVFPAVTTVSFDIAVLELFLPLLVGGRVVVASQAEARDPERLATLLDRVDARVMQATPLTWRLLLDSGWTPSADFTALCGGEKLPEGLARRLCARGVRLWDLYGPTETTVWSSVAAIEDGVVRDFAAVANTTLHVLDERLRPVPVGGRGELYIGGAGLAAGYLRRPALTAERFVPNPYDGSGARLYRTGDVARRHADGRIEILGRTDHQIKIHGFRVEPGEVESVLAAHSAVRDAVVRTVDDRNGEARLVGYVVGDDGAPPPADELARHCAALLPPYMIPSRFVPLSAFPTTPNGKIDRAALPAPSALPASAPPRGSTLSRREQAVADVLAELLDRPLTDPDDDFFALGGDSLLAARAVGRLRALFGVGLGVSGLFEARTIAGITARLTAADDDEAAPLIPATGTGPRTLSFAQRQMWLLHQFGPDDTAYLEPLAVRLPEPFDAGRLERALTALFERHEILRTRYVTDDSGEPLQTVEPAAAIRPVVEDGDPQAILAEELTRPFDLSAGPPVRVRVVRAPDGAHVVLLIAHHIVTDDRSHEVLTADLLAVYGKQPLPSLPVRYSDYALWQRSRMTGARLERGLEFWRRRLAGLEPTELETDRVRPAVRVSRGGTVRFAVPASVVRSLEETGRQRHATPFITLLTGFLAALGRYTGRSDLAIGMPVAERDRPETENLVGLFVNTVVMRTDLAGRRSFTDMVAAVRDAAVETYAHADVPFELVVEHVAPERDLSRNPLVGILFAVHEDGGPDRLMCPDPPGAKFDLGCHLTARPDGGLDGRIEYATSLFDRSTVTRFAEHLRRLLVAVAAEPDVAVTDLAALTTPEAPAAPAVPASGEERATLPELFASRAAAAPGTTVTGHGRTLDFAELDAAANRLAHRLRELGARRGSFVVVRLPQTVDLVVALLAVLKSGAAYIPLDPGHPVQRLTDALADTNAPVVVALTGSLPAPPPGTRLLTPDDPAEQARLAALPTTTPDDGPDPGDPAYAVYTSGSTGRPKAAVVTHGGLANYLRWAAGELPLDADAGSPVHTSLAYDLALTSLYPALVAGAPVELLDTSAGGVEPLATALARARSTSPYGVVKLTPTHLEMLHEVLPAEVFAGSARSLVVAGEQLRGEQLAGWSSTTPTTRVVNSYGPSETSVACCVHVLQAGEATPGPVPIGRPIPGMYVRLLDEVLREVPAGAVGEIHVGGLGVGLGYLNRPGLTARSFVPDPYATEPGARLYRTGDLARRLPDGTLLFLGRRDHQVKIRGFRVEPGEVEGVLRTHPAVRAAVVVADLTDSGNTRLAAHVVADPSQVTVADLRAHLTERLAAHLVPDLWELRHELPLLRNGKVDRRALPALSAPTAVREAHVAPVTPAERLVAEVWADVLGVERVGRDDRFLDLGGQSLLAIRVAARLRDRLPVPVSVRDVFSAQTVAGLAELLARRALAQVTEVFGVAPQEESVTPVTTPASVIPLGPSIPLADRSRPVPLSFAQRRLWLLDQLSPGSTEYLVATVLRLRGRIDTDALSAALTALVRRHEVLRTRYVAEAGHDPVQIVDEPPVIRLAAEHADAGTVLREELDTPVDLATGPVLRARLVRVSAEEHVLVLVIHHIAVDAWSMDVVAAELEAGYRGEPSSEPTVQYADFAVWQHERLSDEPMDELLRYWRGQLAGLDPTELPADRPRPAVRDPQGAVLRFTVPSATAAALGELAGRAGATPFMVGLTSFLVLLARYSGRTDLAVGVPVSGRGEEQLEDLIGFFSNTLVLRADLADDPSFGELLARVRETVGDAFLHDELPFERLVEELAPQRDLSRNPLFQVLFTYRDGITRHFRLPGLEVAAEPVPSRTAKFDLTLELTRDGGGGFTGEIEYATALFDEATVARLARHYVNLLEQAVAAPDTPVSRLEMLDSGERHALTHGAAGALRPRPDAGLPELVAEQAARTPEATAVVCATGRLTYRELDQRANRLARHLRAVGIGRDDVVAVCLPRQPELAVALLGVHRAGAAYLPLDGNHPQERLAWMVEDARARLVIVADASSPAAGLGTPVLDLVAEGTVIEARTGDGAPVASDPDATAYVIYTSGSTGRPKGVAVPHRGIRNRVLWAVDHHGLCADDRLLQKTALTFDASVWEFFGPLVSGGTVVLPPEGVERDPAALIEEVVRHRVTVLQGVPSFYRALADETGLERCTSLRLLFSAGEPLPNDLASRLCARLGAVLVNTYGPTESSIDVTAWTFRPETPAPDGIGVVPIGRALDNTRTVVCAPGGGMAPVGVPGELYIAGEGLARGYLHRPRLTAELFAPDPYGPPGARAYRTGDVVRRRADGVLEFLGRTDHQVKIRGVRVEPGEVEAVLAAHPELVDCVVAARPGPDGLLRLVAYAVPRTELPPHRELRAHVSARLPESYVPSVFVPLDRMPLTTSGKADRAALPDHGDLPDTRDAVLSPPRTPQEKVVAEIVAEVLGLDAVGIDDDFFELGGHSLLAVRVAGRVRAAFGVAVGVRAVFEDRTVAALAARVASGDAVEETTVPTAVTRTGPAPLSFAQQRLWFLDQLAPGSVQYHVTLALRLTGPLDIGSLSGALGDLTVRHDILRTRYVTGEHGEAVQVVDPALPVRLPVTELGELADENELPALLRSFAERPFALAEEVPVRPYLIRLGAEDHVFLLVMHHLVTDAWTEGILVRELSGCYEARLAGLVPTPGPRPLQYADYAAWQRAALADGSADAELAYWRERLAGFESLELRTDRPRPGVRTGFGATLRVPLGDEITGPLLALGRRHGATAYMTFLSVFYALLHRYTGATDLTIGTAVAGRGRPELEDVAGFFVNTVLLRVDVGDDPSVAALIDRVRDRTLDSFAHDELPFDRLVEELAPHRELSRSPLTDIMFGLRETPAVAPRLAGLGVERVGVDRSTAKFDLILGVAAVTGGGYELELEYDTALFDEETIRRLAGHFRRLAASAASDSGRRISELAVLDDAERHQLLREWNDVPAGAQRESLYEAFAAQAARTPDAAAVEGPGERLTYAELAGRATTLAARLRAVGVRPETPVAVCLERSPSAVVALLAVARAGGVYVPLDVTQPRQRLTLMLEDLQPAAVLTERWLEAGLSDAATPVVLVDDSDADAADPAVETVPGEPSRLAYMIYTSGSTGVPKAVMVPHDACVHHSRVHGARHDMRPGDRVLLLAALTFDPSIAQMAAPLLVGATVVAGPGGVVAPPDLPDLLAATGVTHTALPASYFRDMMATVGHRDPRLAGLRVVAVGGEVVTHHDIRMWRESGLPAHLLCVYGPTETTVACLTHTVSDAELTEAPPETAVPIGRPLPGTRAYVLDEAFRPVPVGVAGELYVGGVRVSRGYFRQPRTTAERFVPDPFGDEAGGRLYRTGDQARFRSDGVIEFLGRIDTQVKLRGFRIELGEVEAALASHPALRAAAAAVQEVAPGDRRLVGYVVPRTGQAPSPTELRDFVADRVPEYMVPDLWMTLAELPVNVSQKVNRKALPVPEPDSGLALDAPVAPADEVEEAIAGAWADVLGLETVGTQYDFFRVGGHSLLATRLMARLRDLFGIDVPLRLLFEARTVSEQALALERLAEAEEDAAAGPNAPIGPEGHDDEH